MKLNGVDKTKRFFGLFLIFTVVRLEDQLLAAWRRADDGRKRVVQFGSKKCKKKAPNVGVEPTTFRLRV